MHGCHELTSNGKYTRTRHEVTTKLRDTRLVRLTPNAKLCQCGPTGHIHRIHDPTFHVGTMPLCGASLAHGVCERRKLRARSRRCCAFKLWPWGNAGMLAVSKIQLQSADL